MVLYDSIGKNYDTTRRADPYITGRLIHHLNAKADCNYLDLACGSGNYTLAIQQAGLNIIGIDISERMLRHANRKEPSIRWLLGNIESLPFSDNSFAGAVCVLAIHHLHNLQSAFKEAGRVIASGSMVIFTATDEQMEGYWLNEYFPEAMKKSIMQMPRKNAINEGLENAGFRQITWEPYEIASDLKDFFLYFGKNQPELYLDCKLRNGSSTFSSLADPGEVEKGCAMLKADIESGRIIGVIDSYANRKEGDYTFFIGQK